MDKTIFLTGGTSLFGSAFLNFIPKNSKVIVVEHKLKNQFKHPRIQTVKLNILNKKTLSQLISRDKPDVIVHAAAISNVDYCQSHKKEAWQVNVLGTNNVLEASIDKNIHFIYLSSNAVFDGKKDIYEEKDLPNPVNFYGKTKYQSESLVQKYSNYWTIVRPITMYGWEPEGSRKNPVTWVLKNLSAKKSLKIVDDVYLNPLFNLDLGQVAWKIIANESLGIYHVAGAEILNRYQWALKTAVTFSLDPNLISPVPSSFFTGKIATRPQKTIYSIEKIKKEFKFRPSSVTDGLERMKLIKQPSFNP